MSPCEMADRPPFSDTAYWRPAIDNYVKINTYIKTRRQTKPILTVYEWNCLQEAVNRQGRFRMPVTSRLIKEGLIFQPPLIDHPPPRNPPKFLEESVFGATFDVRVLALPTIWSEWTIPKGTLWPRRPGIVDSVYAEALARRVFQKQEQVLLGLEEPFVTKDVQGRESSPIYGFKTFPGVLQVPIISPTSPDFKAVGTVASVMEMRQALAAAYYYGPYLLVHGHVWDARLDNDYDAEDREGITLRQRIHELSGILPDAVVTDNLPPDDESLFLVQATPDVVRIIPTQEPTIVQWSDDTLRVVMSMTPQIRGGQNGQTGICIGTPRK